MNGPFLFMSFVLMMIGFAAFEGSGANYVAGGCLALMASAFLLTISIRQGLRNSAEARLPYYTRPNRGGWLAGAVYGMVAWVVACGLVLAFNPVLIFAVAGPGMMLFPFLGGLMTVMWRATAQPKMPLPR